MVNDMNSSFTPYSKLSKKKKKELDKARRSMWGISPVTTRSKNPKTYKRRKYRIKPETDE
jgi:hypothetical protein